MHTPPQTQPIDNRQTPRIFSSFQTASVLITGGLFLPLALAVVGLFYSRINYLVGIAMMLPALGFALIFQSFMRRFGPPAAPPPLWPVQVDVEAQEDDLATDWPLATEGQPEI